MVQVTSLPIFSKKVLKSWPQLWRFYSRSIYVSPIFKKGDKHKAENCLSPISLTSITCNLVMEHILINHLDSHSLLTDYQFGFRKERSCESQLLITINDLAEGLRDKDQVDAILLDFSKALTGSPMNASWWNYSHVGVHGNLLAWFHDFLTNRTQQIILEGNKSSSTTVTSVIPQGTVLGPLLFLVFINYLPEAVSSSIRLFADNTLLYRCIRSDTDV